MKKISALISNIPFLVWGFLILFPAIAFAGDTCPSLQTYIDEANANSWIGPVYNIISEACARVADASWHLFATSLQAVLAVGVSIYIALYTLKNVGSFSQQDTAAYLSNDKAGVFILMAKAAFLILLLGNQDFVYEYLIATIIQAGAILGGVEDWVFDSSGSVRSLFDKVIDTINDFNEKAYTIVAIGKVMFCMFHLPDSILDWYFKMLPFGAMAYIFGQVILLFIAFYMMDIMFRLGVGCMLLPMGIACGISKLTIAYTQKLWKLFVNVAFNFVILGLIINFTLNMIGYSIGALSGADDESVSVKGFLEKVAFTESDAKNLNKELSLGAFILLTLSCMAAVKLCMDAEGLAEKVSNTVGGSKLGNGAQKLAGDATKLGANAVKTVAKQPFNIAKAGAQQVGSDMMQSKPVRNLYKKWRRFRSWGKRLVGLP